MSKVKKFKEEIKAVPTTEYDLLIKLSSNKEGYRLLVELHNYAKQGHVTFANATLPQALLCSPTWGQFSLCIELKFTAWWPWDEVQFQKLVEAGAVSIEIKTATNKNK